LVYYARNNVETRFIVPLLTYQYLAIKQTPCPENIALRKELGGFKDPQDLTQLPEITNLKWEEWK